MSGEIVQPDYDEKNEKVIIIPCTDYCGMLVVKLSEFEEVELAMWRPEQHKFPFTWRLRYCWNILRGRPYMDELVLDKNQLIRLADWIKENVKNEVID